MSLQMLREERRVFGQPYTRYVCASCGWPACWAPADREANLEREVRDHLVEHHKLELRADGLGPCGQCGQITDRLRMESELGPGWLCDLHAPAPPTARELAQGLHFTAGDSRR